MKGYIDRGYGRYKEVTVKNTEGGCTVFYRYKNVAIPIYTLPLKDTNWRHNWRMWIGKCTIGRLDIDKERTWRASGWQVAPAPIIKKMWKSSNKRGRLATCNLSGRITRLLNTIEYGSCWYSPEDLVELLHEIGATEARCDYGDDAPI